MVVFDLHSEIVSRRAKISNLELGVDKHLEGFHFGRRSGTDDIVDEGANCSKQLRRFTDWLTVGRALGVGVLQVEAWILFGGLVSVILELLVEVFIKRPRAVS